VITAAAIMTSVDVSMDLLKVSQAFACGGMDRSKFRGVRVSPECKERRSVLQ
jgi:hypothetical protein